MANVLLKRYFFDLWVFLPYVCLYTVWLIAGLQIDTLVVVFKGLHATHAILFCIISWKCFRGWCASKHLGPTIFWLVILLILFLPGTYFEYPSDPWEHFRRLLRWQAGGVISEYPADNKHKFAYFWGWSFLDILSLESRRVALDYYSAFWQLLVAVQVYRLLNLMMEPWLARIGVFVFLAFFGTSVFGLRYYALSSSLLAYAAYLQALIVSLRSSRIRNCACALGYLMFLSLLNHQQELVFLALNVPIVLTHRLWPTLTHRNRMICVAGVVGLLACGFAAGWLLRELKGVPRDEFHASFFGGFPIWNSFYLKTLGVVGWTGIVVSIALLVVNGFQCLFSCLVLAPIFILLWPPTALLVSSIFPSPYLSYRILYAFPAALGVLPLFDLLVKNLGNRQLQRFLIVLLLLVLACVSLIPTSPWQGRMWFALLASSPGREYQQLLPMVKWFDENWGAQRMRQCWIMSDDISRSLLVAHFGVPEQLSGGDAVRRGLHLDAQINTVRDGLVAAARSDSRMCGILAYQKNLGLAVPESTVAQLSGHWISNNGNLNWLVSDGFLRAAAGLPEVGWQVTTLPAGYLLYTPPPRLPAQPLG